ncbi:nuclear transport factor 2 family protein [Modestobacter sp. I12A-02628]|uniref:Nuclear transport factor 2 family protein n=1 Tax=Goekera deserti TaxID=2497753 RepID=A0A7K3WHH0_9ACTN|nr:nuclear transport factor 2 family protein [Goekera deserti]MPR00029.1 nuclear transport factor 2 family protein [Goekera deserti]NDI49808.1 nuclear transport factor 2 family protein [Goekera deserti]NEL55170.1 nuclear transport factor 2 family protein [Goekera deserti]
MSTPTARVPAPPTDPAEQLQWLVDRAAISDLLVEFARTLDEKDFEANTALYLPDGTFTVEGAPFVLVGHEQLMRTGSPTGLAKWHATWHLSANHAIHVDGDTATTRSYLIGVHRFTEDKHRHADGAGWYDCTLRRTPEGWRFATVRIHEVWMAGEPLPEVAPGGPPAAG